jgi:hypothetical protein
LLNFVTLTLDLSDGSGNLPGRTCSASCVPSAVLTDSGVTIIDQAPVSVAFSGIAAPPVKLLATDNPGPQPPGWTWGVTLTGPGMPGPFSFFLPSAPDTFTATDASPCVFTLAGTDAPFAGTGVQLSGGSQPAGFTAGTTYYVVDPSGSSYSLAATPGGDALESTSAGSGSVITVSQVMSNLIPVSSGTTFQGYLPLPSGTPSAGQAPLATGVGEASEWGDVSGGGGGSGTVTSVSVATADGFAGTVANPTTTPAITVKTTVTGILKGNGTSVSAAAAGTDYLAPSGIGSALTWITAAQVGADASGAAAAALATAESFATAAVAGETTRAETAEALLAPLASPALTGAPAAPTAAPLTGDTQVATTAYADAAVAAETARAETAEALKAPLASPALTGSPTAPTQSPGDSTTKIATSAFVTTAVATETSRAEGAESTNAAAIGAETSRAEAAEALALPKAGGTMTGWLAPAMVALTFASSITVNVALGNAFAVTLTASTGTLANPTNPVDGQVIRVRVIQGGSGSFTLAYGTAYDFGAAGAPVLSTAAAKVDILGFEYVASLSKWAYLGSGLGF